MPPQKLLPFAVFLFPHILFFSIFPLDLKNSLWLKGITRREQLCIVSPKLAEEMFEKRNQIGIWFIGEKGHCVCEADQAASMCEGIQNKDSDLYSPAAPDWMGQAVLAPLVKEGDVLNKLNNFLVENAPPLLIEFLEDVPYFGPRKSFASGSLPVAKG